MMGLQKVNALRRMILLMADAAHRDRINDLLNALEEDIGAATFRYAANVARVYATDADRWGRTPDDMHRVVSTIETLDWEREKIMKSGEGDL